MKNEIVEKNSAQLPDTLEDLTQFVLVGKAKLQAYMLKLQTVNKLSTAQEIRDQTLKEAQEVSTALIAAEQRIGELLLAIPKQAGASNYSRDEEKMKTKGETIKEMGYGKNEASDFQQMAKNPEVVQKVIDDALANGEVITKTQVMKEIKAAKDEAKAELEAKMRDLKEERDYLAFQLEEEQSKEPEVREVVKEVVPKDYSDLKRKAEMSEAHEKDFHTMQKAYEEMSEKWKQAEAEKQKLIDEANKPEVEHAEKIRTSALMFCAGVSNFIEKYGGYVWLTEHINEMEPKERKGYLGAINAVESWVTAIKTNMEGLYEK